MQENILDTRATISRYEKGITFQYAKEVSKERITKHTKWILEAITTVEGNMNFIERFITKLSVRRNLKQEASR